MSERPAIPLRQVLIETANIDAIAELQPERRRSVVQLEPGVQQFRLRELAWGLAALQSEHWTRGIRLVLERPTSYLTYGVVLRGDARWMGNPIGPGSILRIDGPWDCSTRGAFQYVAFAVPRASYELATIQVAAPNGTHVMPGTRILSSTEGPLLAARLIGMLAALDQSALDPSAAQVAADELIGIALQLDAPDRSGPKERLPSTNIRRAAVRRVEDYLEAHPDAVPSIPTLCAVAGVSERTLEYAFQEYFGSTPVRYLRLRRLTRVRTRLQNADSARTRVTDVATACGFFELGRFAAEYRKLFGELPSETLAEAIRALGNEAA